MNTKEFQILLKTLFNGAGDYHTDIEFYSTESATLPFRIQGTEGKYYISYIETEKILPFSVGDELVSFDGVPAHEAIKAFKKKNLGNNHTKTDQELTETCFTRRFGSSGIEVPQGSSTIVIKQKNSDDLISHKIEWDYQPENI